MCIYIYGGQRYLYIVFAVMFARIIIRFAHYNILHRDRDRYTYNKYTRGCDGEDKVDVIMFHIVYAVSPYMYRGIPSLIIIVTVHIIY